MLLLCPICAGEFEIELPECPGCGVRLVSWRVDPPDTDPPASDAPTTPAEPADIEFRELCRPYGYPIAMLIKQTLEQNGIRVLVQGGHSMSVLPSLNLVGETRVLVDSSQFEYAREIYDAFFGGSAEFESDGEFEE